MTKTTNAERLRKYRAKMDAFGFKRMSFYVSKELADFLQQQHQLGECNGRTLERLLLGAAAKRPDYYTPEEKRARSKRRDISRL